MRIMTDGEVALAVNRIVVSHRELFSLASAADAATLAELKRLRKALRAIASDTYQTNPAWARGIAKRALKEKAR